MPWQSVHALKRLAYRGDQKCHHAETECQAGAAGEGGMLIPGVLLVLLSSVQVACYAASTRAAAK